MISAAIIHAAPRLALCATVVTVAFTIAACGNDTAGNSAIDRSGIVTDQSRASQSATTVPTRTPVARSDLQASSSSAVVDIISAEGQYTPVDIENLDSFKKSKSYDISGLRDATAAVYGFFGTDPYNRREVEIRFYPRPRNRARLRRRFRRRSNRTKRYRDFKRPTLERRNHTTPGMSR